MKEREEDGMQTPGRRMETERTHEGPVRLVTMHREAIKMNHTKKAE